MEIVTGPNPRARLGPGDGHAQTTELVPRSPSTGRHTLWEETTRHGEEATTKKYNIATKGLKIQTVWNNESA